MKFRSGDFSQSVAAWPGRPVEVDSDQMETLIEKNQHYIMQEIVHILKITDQVLKIICTGLVMFVALMFGFRISYVKKPF